MIGSARQVEEAEGLYVCFNGGRSAHCIALLKLQAVSLHKVAKRMSFAETGLDPFREMLGIFQQCAH